MNALLPDVNSAEGATNDTETTNKNVTQTTTNNPEHVSILSNLL